MVTGHTFNGELTPRNLFVSSDSSLCLVKSYIFVAFAFAISILFTEYGIRPIGVKYIKLSLHWLELSII